ncbi:MAG TPA: RHS repeat-associated core domain-containing protein [Pyrinomonadaceae bacterium]|nr:RHS repeat-associated core domain-containing protein [Pyrinomonadaceae bacterium]
MCSCCRRGSFETRSKTSRTSPARKERDNETGLDYFVARYYSNTQGRFTSVDPEGAGASLDDPQSWNGYAYSFNNPLRFIDPDGLRWAQVTVEGGIQYQWFDDDERDDNGQTAYDRALASGWSAVTFDESKPYSFTNGLLAPGETLTTVTLSPQGPDASSISTHRVTWGEWVRSLYLRSFIDSWSGTRFATAQMNDFVSSIVGVQTNASGDGPEVPGPALGIKLTPSELRKLGGLADRAGEKVADVIRSRGGNAGNVRQAGQWSQKTLLKRSPNAEEFRLTVQNAFA